MACHGNAEQPLNMNPNKATRFCFTADSRWLAGSGWGPGGVDDAQLTWIEQGTQQLLPLH